VAQKEEEGVAYPATKSDHEKSIAKDHSNAVSGLEVVHGSMAKDLWLVDRGGCGVGTGVRWLRDRGARRRWRVRQMGWQRRRWDRGARRRWDRRARRRLRVKQDGRRYLVRAAADAWGADSFALGAGRDGASSRFLHRRNPRPGRPVSCAAVGS
jgi:hypothetical protein